MQSGDRPPSRRRPAYDPERKGDDPHTHPPKRRSGPGIPPGILIPVTLLVIVVVVVVIVWGVLPLDHARHHRAFGIVSGGSVWKVPASSTYTVRFSTDANGSLTGTFTTTPYSIVMMLMNASELQAFQNNSSQQDSLFSTNHVGTASFNWSMNFTGTFFLVAWNSNVAHATNVDWITSVTWTAAPPPRTQGFGVAGPYGPLPSGPSR
ncbi:MAG TPA: hypothetical protein VML53_04565 [Thermoplasmata archaeon]|nr:hypothetical protein [Thermoplasmata archaeon]